MFHINLADTIRVSLTEMVGKAVWEGNESGDLPCDLVSIISWIRF